MLDIALAQKLKRVRDTGNVNHACWDKIIFNKIKMALGGKVRAMATGSAPLAAEVMDFLKVCFCAPMVEGYGMTETASGCFATRSDDPNVGHVGGPKANTKFRLRDVPEMNYLHTNNPP